MSTPTDSIASSLSVPSGTTRVLRLVAGLGGLLFLMGLFVAPREAWTGYLMGFMLYVEMALAGAFFLSILTLASARWAAALRRILEAMATALPVGGLLALVLLGGVHTLYEWSHAGVVESDALLLGKSGYLNVGFFVVRLVVFFTLWILLSQRMIRASRDQDTGGGAAAKRRLLFGAVLFLPIFAVTFSLASVDWLKSLEPHWFSTIYGLITLSSLGSAGLAVCLIIAILLRRGPLRGIVRTEHLDDMGKIGMGLALFWGYIWYCQYMLIWYTNMPEETPYYFIRSQGGWRLLTWVNVTLNWGIPFFALMPKFVRRTPRYLLQIAYVMLIGQALNLFILVGPSQMGASPHFSIFEVAPVIGAGALFFLLVLRGLAAAPLLPQAEPDVAESMEYHC
ncbi:MAG: hypothetical protein ACI8QS_001192 [Planctomycetota bacterium]|jgi:hypothetical protein